MCFLFYSVGEFPTRTLRRTAHYAVHSIVVRRSLQLPVCKLEIFTQPEIASLQIRKSSHTVCNRQSAN